MWKMSSASTRRATKRHVKSPPPPSDVSPPKIRRTINSFKLEIPSLSKISGNLLACGQNDVGQLGLNCDDFSEKLQPTLVPDVTSVVSCKAGGMHSLCLTSSGEVWTFGCNDEGALGRTTNSEDGSEAMPTKIELPGKAVKISAGDSHSACLLENGKVYAWGSFRDSHGNMGLTLEGNQRTPTEIVPGLVAVDVASGNDHLVILAENGNVYTIGQAEHGQLGRQLKTKKGHLTKAFVMHNAFKFVANAIWTSPYCTFMREQWSERIYAFGLNNYHQLGVRKQANKDIEHHPVVSEFTNVKQISGGQHHTIVLTNDNKVYAIGRKDYGRLGLGAIDEDLEHLAEVTSLSSKNIESIQCGDCHTFALSKKGEVFAWGIGTNNQLGTGEDEDVDTPTLLTGAQVKEKNVNAVSGGGQHSLFVVVANDAPKQRGKAMERNTNRSYEDLPEEIRSHILQLLPFSDLMSASMVCPKWHDDIAANRRLLNKIVYKVPGNPVKVNPPLRNYVHFDLKRLPTAKLMCEIFSEPLEVKSLRIWVNSSFAEWKEFLDQFNNLNELHIEQGYITKDCFETEHSTLELGLKKLKCVSIRAKTLKFAAHILGVIAKENELQSLSFNAEGLVSQLEYQSLMTRNMSALLNSQRSLKILKLQMGCNDDAMRMPESFAPKFSLEALTIDRNVRRAPRSEQAEVSSALTKLLDTCTKSCTSLSIAIKYRKVGVFANSLVSMEKLKELKLTCYVNNISDPVFDAVLKSRPMKCALTKLDIAGYRSDVNSLMTLLSLHRGSLRELKFSSIILCESRVWRHISTQLRLQKLSAMVLSETSLDKFRECSIETMQITSDFIYAHRLLKNLAYWTDFRKRNPNFKDVSFVETILQ